MESWDNYTATLGEASLIFRYVVPYVNIYIVTEIKRVQKGPLENDNVSVRVILVRAGIYLS